VIAQYWIALDEKHHYATIVPNVFDRSRPLFDTRGRALKAFDHVRINDPRGSLADDSLMAQANAHFLDQEWLDADYFYGLLRTEYPDSDFLLQAHLLGARLGRQGASTIAPRRPLLHHARRRSLVAGLPLGLRKAL